MGESDGRRISKNVEIFRVFLYREDSFGSIRQPAHQLFSVNYRIIAVDSPLSGINEWKIMNENDEI